MPKLLVALIFNFSVFSAASQLPTLAWSKTFDPYQSGNGSNGRTIGTDAAGNVYSAGFFEQTVDFDPGPGIFMMTGANYYNTAVYISKLDVNGNFVWAKQIPAHLEFSQLELKVDPAGNIFLTSDTRLAADMDPGPGIYTITPTGFRDVFVVKLNTNGDFIWAKQFGGPGDTGPEASMIELDAENNVIITGIFNNTVDFDPGPGVYNLTSTANYQSFIVKLNSTGELIWAKQFGNSPVLYSGSGISSFKCDLSSNIIVTGSFAGTCDFDPGPGVYTATSSSGSAGDGYIAKLDANCNLLWVKTFGQTGNNNYNMRPIGIAIDGLDNIVTTGSFIGDFDFDPGSGMNVHFSNPYDSYILKLNKQGDFVWVEIIGNSAENDFGNDVVTDAANNVYMVGDFGTSVDFDPGPGVFTINSPYYGASALVKLSPEGNFRYAAAFQSISYGISEFRRMSIDAAKNIYITGHAAGLNDFDPGPAVFQVGLGPFVLKLSPCLNPTSSVQTISACNSYTLNNITYDSSGTYFQTLSNAAGCDSTITLYLSINRKFFQQSKTICQGDSIFLGGHNQTTGGIYYDTLHTVQGCDSILVTHLTVNPAPLPKLGPDRNLCKNTQLTLNPGSFASYLWQDNTVQPTFTVSDTGTYWVRVTNVYNCSATDSFKVSTLFPPPTGFLKKTDSLCNYKKLDLSALQTYSNYLWSTGATTKSIQVQSPGIYLLTVTDANGCKGVDTSIVYPKQCTKGVFFPTAFTPDENGKNDRFKALVFGKLKQFHLIIYDRWGSIVFNSSDPEKGWDGKLRGSPLENGIFVWTCTYQLEGWLQNSEKGTVLLIR